MVRVLALLLLFLLLISCDEVNRHEEPNTGAITASCTLESFPSANLSVRAISCPLGNHQLFLFAGFLIGTEDGIIPDNYAALSSGDPCSDLEYVTDSAGHLRRFIPLTDEEAAFNDTSNSGYYALWPIGAVDTSPTDAWIYYDKVLVRGYFDLTVTGTGLAHVTSDLTVTRQTIAGTQPQPDNTLFWTSPRNGWGEGCMRDGGSYIYLFRNSQVDLFGWEARLARVPREHIGNLSEYEYYAGWGEWRATEDGAGVILRDCSSISSSWNAHLQRYIVLHSNGDAVSIRAAWRPWEEWSDPLPLFHDTGAVGFFDIGGVALHPNVNGASGRDLLISYLDHSRVEYVKFELEEK